jgi:hypothetical protein
MAELENSFGDAMLRKAIVNSTFQGGAEMEG